MKTITLIFWFSTCLTLIMCAVNIEPAKPVLIYVISGKRKSGKDYVANALQDRFGKDHSVIIRLSGPLKERYAAENNLDYEKLLDSSEYKEQFRHEMIEWGEDVRKKDPSYFCLHAIEQSGANSKTIWIVSDARRISDVEFFLKNYPTVTITLRINVSESVRKQRGWEFTSGVDDGESECGLDNYSKWHFCLNNDHDVDLLDGLREVLEASIMKTHKQFGIHLMDLT